MQFNAKAFEKDTQRANLALCCVCPSAICSRPAESKFPPDFFGAGSPKAPATDETFVTTCQHFISLKGPKPQNNPRMETMLITHLLNNEAPRIQTRGFLLLALKHLQRKKNVIFEVT